MCAPSADRSLLRASGLTCVDVPDIRNPNVLSGSSSRFADTYTKLNAFRMTHLERAVYLDSDMIVLQNIDELFLDDGFAAVADLGLEHNYDRFNSGLFAFEPDGALFDDLIGRTRSIHSYDQGDQGFLNEVFPDWKPLPHEYNVNKRLSAHHPNLFHLESARVLHFVGVKPWQSEPQTPYDELYRLWFSFLTKDELVELVEELRATDSGAHTARRIRSWFEPLLRLLPGAHGAGRQPGPDWHSGSLLRRTQARNRDGAYVEAFELITEEWPGDSVASPGLLRERAKCKVLSGDIEGGIEDLRNAASRYPASASIQSNLVALERAQQIQRASIGLIPDALIVNLARRFAGST
jgi:hypothetical protein